MYISYTPTKKRIINEINLDDFWLGMQEINLSIVIGRYC